MRDACTRCAKVTTCHKAFDQRPYCTDCYYCHLHRSECTRCGRGIRHASDQSPTLCYRCKDSVLFEGHPCCSCSRIVRHGGRLFEGRPYCSSCITETFPDRACSYCSYVGKKVYTNTNKGLLLPACPKCRSKKNTTCGRCQRVRNLAGTIDHLGVCGECLEIGTIEKAPCPQCGYLRTIGSAVRCYGCALIEAGHKRFLLFRTQLEQPWCQDLFTAFHDDVRRTASPTGVYVLIRGNEDAFRLIDTHVASADEFTEATFLRAVQGHTRTKFGATREWLTASRQFDFTSEAAQQEWHRQKIAGLLSALDMAWIVQLCEAFHAELMLAREKRREWHIKRTRTPMQFKSIRDSIVKLIQFLQVCEEHGAQDESGITQANLERFAANRPKTWHVLGRFIRYWNRRRTRIQRLRLPKTPAKAWNPTHVLPPARRDELYAQWIAIDSPTEMHHACIALLMLHYAQPTQRTLTLKRDDVRRAGDTVEVRFYKDFLPIEASIAARLTKWLEVRVHRSSFRELRENPFLFPGRKPDAGVSPQAFSEWLKQYGITLRQLTTTSLTAFFEEGLEDPSPLITELGVKPATAMKYWRRSSADTSSFIFKEGLADLGALRSRDDKTRV